MTFEKRTLCKSVFMFFGSTGVISIIISMIQFIVFREKFSLSIPFLTWIPFVLVPFLIGLILLLIFFLLKKSNYLVQKTIGDLLNKRSRVTIVFLFISILLILGLSRTLNLNDPVVNLGMSWLGVLFYAILLNLLVFISYRQIKNNKADSYKVLSISLICIAFVWLFLAVTRIGLQPDQAFWNVAGVPMMWVSLASILLSILLIHEVSTWIKIKKGWNSDPKTLVFLEIFIVLGIWLVASLVWINTPYSNSHFLLGPLPPDGYYLPKSDAILMDLGGQYMIIGSRLETPYFTEKPFYSFFLGILHFIFGQSYQTITNIQITFLALFPVLLYLLGKKLSGRLFGLALAIFAIIKETTALLFTYKISVSNSRLMMTEFPSALLLVLLALFLFIWLHEKKNGFTTPLLAGGTIGLAMFIRSNNIVVFFVVLVFLILTGFRDLKQRVPQILFFLLGVTILMLPWIFYNQVTYGRDPIRWKVQSALETRFIAGKNPDTRNDMSERQKTKLPPEQLGTKEIDQVNSALIDSTETSDDTNTNLPTVGQQEPIMTPFYRSKGSMVLGHFLNNQVKSLFVLPFQLYPARPTTILEQEYWHEPVSWDGDMPAEHVIAFIVNLCLISLGLQYAFSKFKWAGLVPLILQLSYYVSNALVRTSGSRYLVPADWVVYLYFLLGLWSVLRAIKLNPKVNLPKTVEDQNKYQLFWISLSVCLLIGFSLPVINLSFPTLYHDESKYQVLQRLPMEKIEQEIEITPSAMDEFYKLPNTLFLYGKEIYPAYLPGDNGPIDKGLRFTLLTPTLYEVVIPYGIDLEEKLPDGEDMIALGCKYPGTDQVITYLVYFVQSDRLIWSTSTTFKDICQ